MFGRITDPARGRHKTIHVMQDLFKISFFVTCGRHSSFKWHLPQTEPAMPRPATVNRIGY